MSNEKKLIEQTAQATAQAVVSELKRQGLMKDNKQTPFQKTETLLYNYNNFQEAIKDKYLQIETIQTEGIPKKFKSEYNLQEAISKIFQPKIWLMIR